MRYSRLLGPRRSVLGPIEPICSGKEVMPVFVAVVVALILCVVIGEDVWKRRNK
jgi:hypothetical protein